MNSTKSYSGLIKAWAIDQSLLNKARTPFTPII